MKITRTAPHSRDPLATFDLTEEEFQRLIDEDKVTVTCAVAGSYCFVVSTIDGGDKVHILYNGACVVVYEIPSRPRRYKFDDCKLKDILARGVFTPREAFLSHSEDFPNGYLESDRDFLENNNDFAVELLEALIPVIP